MLEWNEHWAVLNAFVYVCVQLVKMSVEIYVFVFPFNFISFREIKNENIYDHHHFMCWVSAVYVTMMTMKSCGLMNTKYEKQKWFDSFIGFECEYIGLVPKPIEGFMGRRALSKLKLRRFLAVIKVASKWMNRPTRMQNDWISFEERERASEQTDDNVTLIGQFNKHTFGDFLSPERTHTHTICHRNCNEVDWHLWTFQLNIEHIHTYRLHPRAIMHDECSCTVRSISLSRFDEIMRDDRFWNVSNRIKRAVKSIDWHAVIICGPRIPCTQQHAFFSPPDLSLSSARICGSFDKIKHSNIWNTAMLSYSNCVIKEQSACVKVAVVAFFRFSNNCRCPSHTTHSLRALKYLNSNYTTPKHQCSTPFLHYLILCAHETNQP